MRCFCLLGRRCVKKGHFWFERIVGDDRFRLCFRKIYFWLLLCPPLGVELLRLVLLTRLDYQMIDQCIQVGMILCHHSIQVFLILILHEQHFQSHQFLKEHPRGGMGMVLELAGQGESDLVEGIQQLELFLCESGHDDYNILRIVINWAPSPKFHRQPHDRLLHLCIGVGLGAVAEGDAVARLADVHVEFVQSFIPLEILVVLLYEGLEFFGVEDDPIFCLVGVCDVDDPHPILMVLSDGLAAFLKHLALAELVVGGCHFLQVHGQHPASHSCYFELGQSFFSLEVDFDILDDIESIFQTLLVDEDVIVEYGVIGQESVVLVFQVFDELFGVVGLFFFAEDALEDECIEHVLVGYVDVLLQLPRLRLAVGTSVLIVGDDLVVQVAEDAFTFLAFLGVVERDAVADGTRDQLVLQEGFLPDPFLVDNDQFGLLGEFVVRVDVVCALLHPIIDNISMRASNILIRLNYESRRAIGYGQVGLYAYGSVLFNDLRQCIVLIMSNPSQKQRPGLQRLKEQAQRKGDIQAFIRSYQLKQKAAKQLLVIYSRHCLTEHFASTFKAAVALLVVPSLTNIYYAVRSHSILSGVLPFAVPVACLANYIYFMNRDMQRFALSSHPDADEVRSHYQIIYQLSYFDRNNESFMKKMENFRTDQSRNQKVIGAK